MDPQALFGRRVRAVRDAAGLSRESTAERASINANYLGEIERGEKWPSLEVIISLAGAVGVSPAVFFEFESEENDAGILAAKLQAMLSSLSIEELQTAFRVVKALLRC